MSKLPKNVDDLWLKPKNVLLHYTNEEWYEPRQVGRDNLDHFMKLSICKNVTLDGDYTNHSICATVIETLDKAGFEAHHIIKLTSHKSESTVKEYACKCSESKRKEMFKSLTEAMETTPKRQRTLPTATVTKPQDSTHDVKNNIPNFELQELDDFDTIDDNALQELMIEFENKSDQTTRENQDLNILAPQMSAIARQNHQINTQVNTFNQMPFPRMPSMYFPNSNVTINYNFGK